MARVTVQPPRRRQVFLFREDQRHDGATTAVFVTRMRVWVGTDRLIVGTVSGTRLLLCQWVQYLAQERLGASQVGMAELGGYVERRRFGDQDLQRQFLLGRRSDDAWVVDGVVGFRSAQIDVLVQDAVARTNAWDTGPPVVYRCQLQTSPVDLTSRNFQSNFLRLLSQQVTITGARRLGTQVLLDFMGQARSA